MLAYVVRRVVAGALLLVVMSIVVFYLFFAGGDPVLQACGKNCTEDRRKQTEKALGFDEPVHVQWAHFAVGIVAGRDFPANDETRQGFIDSGNADNITNCPAPCFGYSDKASETVRSQMADRIPISVSIAIMAFTMWIVGGILLGIGAALTQGSIIDRGIVGFSLLLYAFPTFVIGSFLLKFVAVKWELVDRPVYQPIADGGVVGWASSLVLPGLTLAAVYLAGYVRITRAFVLESQTEDYVRTARSKGLQPRRVLFKHTMRAALTPLVTMAGLDLAALLGGAIITEAVFNYDGLGRLAVTAVTSFDLPVTVGIVLLLASFVIIANIIVDLLYAVIDPRVRVG